MAHHSTEITTKCGRKVLFKKSSKSVTGFSGVLMFKDALKKSTFVQNICDTVNYWFPRDSIAKTAQDILDARDNHPESSFADLYDDLLMEPDLRKAHKANDKAVLEAYGLKADATESEIVAHLIQLYVEKVAEVNKNEAMDAAVQKVLGKKAEAVPDWMQELRQLCLDGRITPDELIVQGKARFKEEKKKAKEAEKAASKVKN